MVIRAVIGALKALHTVWRSVGNVRHCSHLLAETHGVAAAGAGAGFCKLDVHQCNLA